MTVTPVIKGDLEVPTIDLSPFLADPTSIEALKVVSAVRQACMSLGFFQLVGHGVPKTLQKQVFQGAKKLFDLPLEEKKKMERKVQSPLTNRGYEVMGTQMLQKGTSPDQKEGFYLSQSFPSDHPKCARYPTFVGPNVFPPSTLIPDSELKEPMETYYAAMRKLSSIILTLLAAGLPYGPNLFNEFDDEPLAAMRVLHYPPADAMTLGAGQKLTLTSAHTDFGAFTLLLQDDHAGLQVLNPDSKEWMPIYPNPEAYVVNIGDMMQRWTQGQYKSNLHRVINYSSEERYSVPFFFDGNLECKLDPFDGTPPEGGSITVFGHMTERFAATYIAAKA